MTDVKYLQITHLMITVGWMPRTENTSVHNKPAKNGYVRQTKGPEDHDSSAWFFVLNDTHHPAITCVLSALNCGNDDHTKESNSARPFFGSRRNKPSQGQETRRHRTDKQHFNNNITTNSRPKVTRLKKCLHRLPTIKLLHIIQVPNPRQSNYFSRTKRSEGRDIREWRRTTTHIGAAIKMQPQRWLQGVVEGIQRLAQNLNRITTSSKTYRLG